MRRNPIAVIVAVLMTIVGLSGCTFTPDRQAEADQLESEIAAMPGVEDISVVYSNELTLGVYLHVDVTMTRATEAQIADVGSRIVAIEHDKFDDYDRSHTFIVGDKLDIEDGEAELDSGRIVGDTQRLRAIGASLPGAEISSFFDQTSPRIEIRDAPPAAESLTAVRNVLGDGPATLQIQTTAPEPVWHVDFPFSSEQEQSIQRKLAELPVADVDSVRVVDGRITGLIVEIGDPRTAYRDLVTIIGAIGPTRENPLGLEWGLPGSTNAEREFRGSAYIYGCPEGRTAGEENPERFYTPDAVDLQKRMQNEFETCPK
ncbi:hypothetical protein B0T36_19785 [Nocardia donostiensis]|uniref:hypothetical protein n=1 Tax=Nocardia donostiensis TaxID=1538463 RepID=UPI0009DA3CC1|nr:hypothetical protein [Nocardia donostiensis]OQS13356.1 hypothetical protein B0T36_19785 [Nocardia donostiensis]